jgi:hypothetical protein
MSKFSDIEKTVKLKIVNLCLDKIKSHSKWLTIAANYGSTSENEILEALNNIDALNITDALTIYIFLGEEPDATLSREVQIVAISKEMLNSGLSKRFVEEAMEVALISNQVYDLFIQWVFETDKNERMETIDNIDSILEGLDYEQI